MMDGSFCIYCGESNSSIARFCFRCGKPTGQTAAEIDGIKCWSCSQSNNRDFSFCYYCGASLTARPDFEQKPVRRRKFPWKLIGCGVLIIGALAICGIVGIPVIFLGSGSTNPGISSPNVDPGPVVTRVPTQQGPTTDETAGADFGHVIPSEPITPPAWVVDELAGETFEIDETTGGPAIGVPMGFDVEPAPASPSSPSSSSEALERHSISRDGYSELSYPFAPYLQPIYGALPMFPGFAPDPFKMDIIAGGYVDIAESYQSPDCKGFATQAPTVVVNWDPETGGNFQLNIFFISGADGTLVVRSPSGDWYCLDDYQGEPHPLIVLGNLEYGAYAVWAGVLGSDTDRGNGELYISDSNYTPLNYTTAGSSSPAASGDDDADGISNALEHHIAETFVPAYEFDEEEHTIYEWFEGAGYPRINEDIFFLYQVSPVQCGLKVGSFSGANLIQFILEPEWEKFFRGSAEIPSHILDTETYLLTVVAVFRYDYLPFDAGPGENDLFAHYGDTERVRICISRDGDQLRFTWMWINRHHETAMYLPSWIDEWYLTHPHLYVSEGKHATFTSERECRDSVRISQIWENYEPNLFLGVYGLATGFDKNSFQALGWREDCGGGDDPLFILPSMDPTRNVGEYVPGQRITTATLGNEELASALEFPEAIWSPHTQDKDPVHRDGFFCGGFDHLGYSGTHSVTIGYESPLCGGSLDSKWFPTNQDDRDFIGEN